MFVLQKRGDRGQGAMRGVNETPIRTKSSQQKDVTIKQAKFQAFLGPRKRGCMATIFYTAADTECVRKGHSG